MRSRTISAAPCPRPASRSPKTTAALTLTFTGYGWRGSFTGREYIGPPAASGLRCSAWTCARWPSAPTSRSSSGRAPSWRTTARGWWCVRRPIPTYRHWGNFYLLDRPPTASAVDGLIAAYDADFPDSTHRAFGVDGTADLRASLRPLISAGLVLENSTVMTASAVHPPPRPQGSAEYRMFDSGNDWEQKVDLAMAVHQDEFESEAYREFAVRKAAHDRSICEAGHVPGGARSSTVDS